MLCFNSQVAFLPPNVRRHLYLSFPLWRVKQKPTKMTITPQIIHALIDAIMRDENLTVQEPAVTIISEEVGVSRSAIFHWLSGQRKPSGPSIAGIKRLIGKYPLNS